MTTAKVLVAMSGGVDSSVAVKLLQTQGYQCQGVTLRLRDAQTQDLQDAQNVATKCGISHQTIDARSAFHDQVVAPFVQAYQKGQTPNPCIRCNRALKFGQLLPLAAAQGCQYLATGHYAQITFDGQRYHLEKAVDATKDQSYFLYTLKPAELAHLLFPLGALSKEQTRAIAAQTGFANAHKPDSQDICFIPGGNYTQFIYDYVTHNATYTPEKMSQVAQMSPQSTYTPEKMSPTTHNSDVPGLTPGDIVDEHGNVLGQHRGLLHYTIGQRKGLGIAHPTPLYVCALDCAQNRVIVGPQTALYQKTLLAGTFNWLEDVSLPCRCAAKIRYRHTAAPATVTYVHADPDDPTAPVYQIVFEQPQRAITPGQAVVLYQGNRVLGGGTILAAH